MLISLYCKKVNKEKWKHRKSKKKPASDKGNYKIGFLQRGKIRIFWYQAT